MLRENLGSFLVFDWKSIKEIIPLWWILFRLIDSPWIIASFCSSYPYFLFFYSWDLGRSTMMDLKFATEPSVHSLDWINISCITVRCIWDISIVFMWCILNFAIFPRVWFDFKGFLVLRKRPPAPLALFSACWWRDSWRYGCRTILSVCGLTEFVLREKRENMINTLTFRSLMGLLSASSFARYCLRLRIAWYCFEFTYIGSSAKSNWRGIRTGAVSTGWTWGISSDYFRILLDAKH